MSEVYGTGRDWETHHQVASTRDSTGEPVTTTAAGLSLLCSQLGALTVCCIKHACRHACMLSRLSRVQVFVTPRTVAHQAPESMGFSRQEYWSELPFPPPGDLPDPGIEALCLLHWQADSNHCAIWEAQYFVNQCK